ncbi:MAG: YegS/Rv2252/BmrU family lipid kinase, partial [Lachnospiraceae bacterium]|nr:YegS/Rv2252/BmrU family lipid kinase [Lachnospiraceae bacterium]
MNRLLFVYNPKAGKGKVVKHINQIKAAFKKWGWAITMYQTKAPKDGKREIMERASEFDMVVCAGGDGTLSETVSAMMELEESERKPVGFVPTGSTNDTGKTFGLPKDILEAVNIAALGMDFPTDIGRMNDQYFTYVTSFGKLSAVSCFTPQDLKKEFGRAAYISEGVKALIHLESYNLKVQYEDEEGNIQREEGDYYLGMVTNTFSVGGFSGITGKNVDLQDGLFEVILLRRPNNLRGFAKQVNNMLISPDRDKSTVEV